MKQNSKFYLNFKLGTLEIPREYVKISYKKNDITHITILDPSKITVNNKEGNSYNRQQILESSLEDVVLLVEAKYPITFTYYPRLLESKDNTNLLQTVKVSPQRIHISFKDYAFQVKDLKDNTLILIKDLKAYNKKLKVVKPYPTKILSEKVKEHV